MTGSTAGGDLSLQEIEADDWGDPPTDATTLVATVLRLRRVPVGALDAEGVRLLVAQQVGLDALVPRALTWLEADPLLEGDYYPGDVLVAVLRAPADYWVRVPAQRARLERILAELSDPDAELEKDIAAFRNGS